MPVAVGFHPYFRVDDAPRDAWTIGVGAKTEWLLSPDKIPTGETRPIEQRFPDPRSAGCASTISITCSPISCATARDWRRCRWPGRSQRIEVLFGPSYRAAVIYAPKGRDFICFEPMAGITDSMNLAQRGLYKELQHVAPGGRGRNTSVVRPSGF